MLRQVLLGFAILLCLVGLGQLVVAPQAAFPTLFFGGLLLVGTVFERWRYKAAKAPHAARGAPTGERFIDTETGELMEVYYDAATGERSYVKVDKLKG